MTFENTVVIMLLLIFLAIVRVGCTLSNIEKKINDE